MLGLLLPLASRVAGFDQASAPTNVLPGIYDADANLLELIVEPLTRRNSNYMCPFILCSFSDCPGLTVVRSMAARLSARMCHVLGLRMLQASNLVITYTDSHDDKRFAFHPAPGDQLQQEALSMYLHVGFELEAPTTATCRRRQRSCQCVCCFWYRCRGASAHSQVESSCNVEACMTSPERRSLDLMGHESSAGCVVSSVPYCLTISALFSSHLPCTVVSSSLPFLIMLIDVALKNTLVIVITDCHMHPRSDTDHFIFSAECHW